MSEKRISMSWFPTYLCEKVKLYSFLFLSNIAEANGFQRSLGSEKRKDIFPIAGKIFPLCIYGVSNIRQIGIKIIIASN